MAKHLITLLFTLFSFESYTQPIAEIVTSDKVLIDERIALVFGDQLQKLVLEDRDRRKSLEDILEWRTQITELQATASEKLPKLSTIALFDRYNPDLVRDTVFDPKTFNVLKYNLPFYSQYKKMFRIDNTNYVLTILPKKRNK